MIHELSTIQHAITDNIKVLAELEPVMFFADYCVEIVQALKVMDYNGVEITYDNLRANINQGKLKYKRSVLDKIQEIETGIYGYTDDFIQDIKVKYRNIKIKEHTAILAKIGTDECTDADIEFHTNAINDLYKSGVELASIKNADDMRIELLARTEENLTDSRIYLTDNILKKAIGDFIKPKLYVISGYPGSGKNALTEMLIADTLYKHKGLYMPYDNSDEESWHAVACSMTNIKYGNIENNDLTEKQRDLINMRSKLFKNLWITDKHYTGSQIEFVVEKMVKEHGIEFMVLDFFQSIPISSEKNSLFEREQNVKMFKRINSEFNIPTIIISQLNKDGAQKWCTALYEQSYMVIKIFAPDADNKYLRTINVERNKKGGEPTFNVTIDGEHGIIRETEF